MARGPIQAGAGVAGDVVVDAEWDVAEVGPVGPVSAHHVDIEFRMRLGARVTESSALPVGRRW